MSNWNKPKGSGLKGKIRIAKFFAAAALLFGGYQYYMPNGPKDSFAKVVTKVTHSETVGHIFNSDPPPWQKPATQTPPAPPAPGTGK